MGKHNADSGALYRNEWMYMNQMILPFTIDAGLSLGYNLVHVLHFPLDYMLT